MCALKVTQHFSYETVWSQMGLTPTTEFPCSQQRMPRRLKPGLHTLLLSLLILILIVILLLICLLAFGPELSHHH